METPLSSNDLSDVPFDIVMNNTVPSFLNSKKFVDYSQYIYEENPYYDDLIWADADAFDALALPTAFKKYTALVRARLQ